MTQPTYTFIIEEPAKLKLLQNAWMDGNSWGFTKEQIINYLCYRVLWSNQGYLPMPQDIIKNDYVLHRPTIGKKFWGSYDNNIDVSIRQGSKKFRLRTPLQSAMSHDSWG
jgi:hypothetical protein